MTARAEGAGVFRPQVRLHIPRAEELPQGVSRCGGWGDGTVMYLSDQHCGELTPHVAHLVPEVGLAPLQRASMLQLVVGLAQTCGVAPVTIKFEEAAGYDPVMRVQLPDEERHAVALYGRLFGCPEPFEVGWIRRISRVTGCSFVAENFKPGRPLFCGWRVDVSCFVATAGVTH